MLKAITLKSKLIQYNQINAIPVKFPTGFMCMCVSWQDESKFYMENVKAKWQRHFLEKTKAGEIVFPGTTTYFKDRVMSKMW